MHRLPVDGAAVKTAGAEVVLPALGWDKRKDLGWIFGSLLSSKVVVSGHCLATLSFTVHQTSKWLSSLTILMQESGCMHLQYLCFF